jgi:hypothetical protein
LHSPGDSEGYVTLALADRNALAQQSTVVPAGEISPNDPALGGDQDSTAIGNALNAEQWPARFPGVEN